MQTYQLADFTMPVSTSSGRLNFYLGKNNANVYFDNVWLTKLNDANCNQNKTDNHTSIMIDVFPNPVVGAREAFVKLAADTNETVHIEIINVVGTQVAKIPANIYQGNNVLNFPTDNLAAGTYFIRVRGEDWFSSARKFIKINN